MKKFVMLTYGYQPPTPEIMNAWMKWFKSIGKDMVDPGNPLGPGKEITKTGMKDLPLKADSLTGYLIINAPSMDKALKIAQTCPIISSIRVYEAVSM